MRASTLTLGGLFAAHALALDPIVVKGQDFINSGSGQRFEVLGIDYQPGGEAAYNPATGTDTLGDPSACLRDAALMQRLGVNTIRTYNLDPDVNHDQCASIFNAAGIYMILDVNSPLPGESINQADPASTYDLSYLNRTFAIVDAFRGYPNTLGFFSANELVNNDQTGTIDPPYIRAVTRDLKQYIAARGGRPIPVGYSAADISDILVANWEYVQCHLSGDDENYSRSDFFGLNDYQWCGMNTFAGSGYQLLTQQFADTTIPVLFSEYGCNKVQPRIFQEVGTLYGSQMTVFSGGLIYQWSQETDNFGLININSDGSAQLRIDYDNLQAQYDKLDLNLLQSSNATATALQPPTCTASLVSAGSFNTSFALPTQPPGVLNLINKGVGGNTGAIVSVTATSVTQVVLDVSSSTITGLTISSVSSANVPAGSASGIVFGTTTISGSGASTATPTKGAATANMPGQSPAIFASLASALLWLLA